LFFLQLKSFLVCLVQCQRFAGYSQPVFVQLHQFLLLPKLLLSVLLLLLQVALGYFLSKLHHVLLLLLLGLKGLVVLFEQVVS